MQNISVRQRGIIALALVGALAAGLAVQAAGDGPPNRVLPYQGRLELNGNPPSGMHSIRFVLHDDPVAGAVLHDETIDVAVAGGSFSAMIGAGSTPLTDGVYTAAELFLELQVDGTPLDGRQQIFASHRAVDPPGEFSSGKHNITAQPGGALGWRIATDLTGPTAAIRHLEGGLQLGFHQNENLYLADVNAAPDLTYMMIVEKGPAVPGGGIGTGLLRVGSLSLGTDSSLISAMQFGKAGDCNGGPVLATPDTINFPQPFATEPTVLLNINEEDQAGCTEVRLEGVTTTGFTIRSWALGIPSACGCVEYVAFAN